MATEWILWLSSDAKKNWARVSKEGFGEDVLSSHPPAEEGLTPPTTYATIMLVSCTLWAKTHEKRSISSRQVQLQADASQCPHQMQNKVVQMSNICMGNHQCNCNHLVNMCIC